MRRLAVILIALLLSLAAHAGPEQFFPLDEFKSLAVELSHKVNLFADAWEIDPKAEFFGGTTRDYLYWLKGKFSRAKSRADVERVKARLRAEKIIDVRDFIIGESDVDIVSRKSLHLAAENYGVHKIDSIDGDRFNPSTEKGENELSQGYIPVEKIRLGKDGFIDWPGVGDGIKELYTGKITVNSAEDSVFNETLRIRSISAGSTGL